MTLEIIYFPLFYKKYVIKYCNSDDMSKISATLLEQSQKAGLDLIRNFLHEICFATEICILLIKKIISDESKSFRIIS